MFSRFNFLLLVVLLTACSSQSAPSASSASVNATSGPAKSGSATLQCKGVADAYCTAQTQPWFVKLDVLNKRLVSKNIPRVAQKHARWSASLKTCLGKPDQQACIEQRTKQRISYLKIHHKLQPVSHSMHFKCAVSMIEVKWYDTPTNAVWVKSEYVSQLMYNIPSSQGLKYENTRSRLWVYDQKAMIWIARHMPHQECQRVAAD
ncbi:hypothetical protein IT774_15580 [Salinimonas marina]|uniref:Lipoprotein n=1 Tax=Salinimonas marina TaxID=2785918 RepID=A0A7S9DXH0_9ALTE|nr:hypothetical protein [Salinimonas marina]QPG05493.1 hypothetical protein IT774_15580 [Salinimonas marina]